jgi:hypothetical protein
MSLLFTEGFELYDASNPPTHMNGKWTIYRSYGVNRQTGNFFGYGIGLGGQWSGTEDWIRTVPVTAGDTFIVGFYIRRAVSNAQGVFFRAYDGSNLQLEFRFNGTAIEVYRGVTLAHTFSGALDHGTDTRWHHIQIKMTIGDTGSVGLIVNGGAEASSGAIDTDQMGTAQADRFEFASSNSGYASLCWIVDHFWVCDDAGSANNDYLGQLIIEGIRPNGAGDSTEWTPSAGANYECVDDTSEVDYNDSGTTGDLDLYAMSNLSEVASSIKGVSTTAWFKNTGSGTPSITLKCKSGSSTADGDTEEVGSTGSFEAHHHIFEVDPATSSAWMPAAVNSVQLGAEHTA